MSNVINFQEYKDRRKKEVQGVRLGGRQYSSYVIRIMNGWELKRIRLIEGEPLVVMEKDNEVLFIEYDGYTIRYDKDTIEAP